MFSFRCLNLSIVQSSVPVRNGLHRTSKGASLIPLVLLYAMLFVPAVARGPGAVLAQVRQSHYVARVNQAQSQLDAARASLKQAESQLAEAKVSWAQTKSQLAEARAQVEGLEDKVSAAVDIITSNTYTGLSVMYVELHQSVDEVGKEFDDIQIKLDVINGLPDGAGQRGKVGR